jgi:hypothetical protein
VSTFTVDPPPRIAAPLVGGAPAVQEALRQQAAALIQHTYRWLEAAIPDVPQLSAVVPTMVTAVQLYQAQQYPACLNQITAVIANLQQARGVFPTLRPL